ncbi:MAG: hypothetical protein JXR73_21480 [Candidatus Omnitrophica bacterium]|nr:hypothetical protein [Candidatus Omnitrophota bacterium]
MDSFYSSPESISQLLLEGEANQIYKAIQRHADICLDLLQKSENSHEIEAIKSQSLRRQIKDTLSEASNLRFTLHTNDKKIQQEQKNNPDLRKITEKIRAAGQTNTMETLADYLGDLDEIQSPPKKPDPLYMIRSLVVSSLKNRIQMAWCCDEIIEVHRSALVGNLINIAHRLTEVALILQDSQVIQEVRAMLKSLKLDLPAKSRMPTLQSSPAELKSMLKQGIASMQKTYEDIKTMDSQRIAMKEAVKKLNEKLGGISDEAIPSTEQTKPKAVSIDEESQKRMVYPTLRKKFH